MVFAFWRLSEERRRGREEGRAEGLEEGRAEGRAEGLEKGRVEMAQSNAGDREA